MDYPLQRLEFYKQLNVFFDLIVLTPILLDSFNQFFSVSMECIQNFSDERKKSFILIELTKNRYSCNQVIRLLRQSNETNNKELADRLEKINTSPGRHTYSDNIEIAVTPTQNSVAFGGISQAYPMTQKPRGMAIIINNVKNIVQREAERFECVFKQLLFEVEVLFNLTAHQIHERLTQIRDGMNEEYSRTEYSPQALIVMVISHGNDERLWGRNACNDRVKYHTDKILTKDIVDIFSDDNIQFDSSFVKMFFFTACREVFDEEYPQEMRALKSDVDNTSDTIIYYSCAEGYETEVDDYRFYTYFGKIFSESIAQYAHKEDLTQIMNRTNCELREKRGQQGHFAPESRIKCLTQSVFFNPHWWNDQGN